MSTDTAMQPKSSANVPAIAQPRLPYHPGLKERFGIDQTEWRALVESTFPSARSVGAVILALAYCKARNLDPFKKTVHIVPIWDKERGCEVETVWPGIAEYRTTASRTAAYAGHDEVVHGPMIEQSWEDTGRDGKKYGDVKIKFPEWSQMTVYRIVQGQRCAFPGPKVYWLETYACKKSGCPNTMWADRPIGMIDKCAEAAALRSAFPEELGGEPSYEEWGGFRWHGRGAIDAPAAASVRNAIDGKSVPVLETQTEAAEIESPVDSQPELQQEDQPEPGAESDLLDECADQLAQAETIEAVKILQAKYLAAATSPDAKQKVTERAEMRIAAIRGQRGDRTNRQKSLMDGGASATERGT